ncbi:MAG: MOSC domain-containing protein [Bryobacterales bacterium]|nr:MOSC domain-containing protein [Bryobacterales bacterium]
METRVLAVCVGLIERVPYRGRQMRTGIFKRPVEGRVHIGRLGLAGDHQADPRYHGGPRRAVYAYPSEHYSFWRGVYPDVAFGHGGFGENLATAGWMEDAVREGDVYRVGTALLKVTEPRTPCIKLGVKFGRTGIVAKFRESRRTGFYLAVREEGFVEAGDAITLVDRDPGARSVAGME